MNGSAPSPATAAANGATSLTRVIGPCATGIRTPSARANGASGSSTPAASASATASLMAARMPHAEAVSPVPLEHRRQPAVLPDRKQLAGTVRAASAGYSP